MSVKQASKRKRVAKAAVPALGAAGLTFSLAGGASASTLPAADTAQKLNFSPTQGVLLGEEEIADVSLSTFHLFDKEQGTVTFAEPDKVAEHAATNVVDFMALLKKSLAAKEKPARTRAKPAAK